MNRLPLLRTLLRLSATALLLGFGSAAHAGYPLCQTFSGSQYCLSDIPVVGSTLQGAVDTAYNSVTGIPLTPPSAPGNADAELVAGAVTATAQGCDLLDPSNCLYPFPNDFFTVAAAVGSPQSVAKGGTGRRVNINQLGTPHNTAGRPVDPTEWNRNDGFSPGALIATYVPGLSLEKTYGLSSNQIGIANIGLSQNANSPILVLEVPTGAVAPKRHLVWSEIDANANLLTPAAAPQAGEFGPDVQRPTNDGRAALLIRPAKNFTEGRRYVVVLRNLKNTAGQPLAAQAGFAACKAGNSPLPPVQARCAQLSSQVLPVLAAANINLADVYLAWDFTVASTNNQVGRLRHMRDDAFASLSKNLAANDCTQYSEGAPCAAPTFTVDKVTLNPQSGIARRIEGVITVPSYVVPVDPAPLEDPAIQKAADSFCATLPASAPAQFREGCKTVSEDGLGIGGGISLPPNRLFYSPAGGSPVPDASNTSDPASTRYGDGLPDRTGSMTTRYICQIPAQATPNSPARPGIYGHGLLDSRSAVTYDGVPDMSREFNFMFCAVDFFGFATGDIVNVATQLTDISLFPVVPDASQQGMLNFMFLARLLRDPQGFASHPAFQSNADRRPLFNNTEVVYDGNSQGGILGGVILAADKDLHRGVLGSLGMNYSTLLTRSKDFDEFASALYLAYTDPLDRQLLFSMIQMLWDRSENNGYAAHLTDNSAFGGVSKAAKLDTHFSDQQVSMWSADVMARTMGIPVDASQIARVQGNGPQRHPDLVPYFAMDALNYTNPAQTGGSAEVVWDDADLKVPPITNTPPRTGNDPHDRSAKTVAGRCQKAHFLATGRLIDVNAVKFGGQACPALPPAAPSVAVSVAAAPSAAGSVLGFISEVFSDLRAVIAGIPDSLSGIPDTLTGIANNLVALLSGDDNSAASTVATAAASAQAGNSQGVMAALVQFVVGSPAAPSTALDLPAAQPLMAGAATGSIEVPVGTPLGGYLRPPVGGEYLPGLEALAGSDPNVLFNELIDFIPSQSDDGQPLLPVPDELRKIHSPYATYSAPSRGYYDSLLAKAVALYDGHDYVVLVKTDFIGMLDEVVQGVIEKVKADKGIDLSDGLVMSATHSHDGPGAVANNSTRYFWLAVDAYQPEVFERLVPQLAKVVEDALDNLQPAKFGYGIGTEKVGLNRFRRSVNFPGYDNDCNFDGVDSLCNDAMLHRLGVLRVDKLNGEPLALVMNYAVHGIAFDVENQYFSGDVLASAEREVEASFGSQPVMAMLVQNTGGNISPSTGDGPTLQRIERYGKKLAPEILAVYDGIAQLPSSANGSLKSTVDLRSVSQRVILSREKIGYPDTDGKHGDGDYPYPYGAPQCNNDIAAPFVGGGVEDVPGYNGTGLPTRNPSCLAGPVPDAADLADNGVAENGAFVPQDTRLTAVQIGSALLLAQPGEPLTEYGLRVLKAAKTVGYENNDTFIWGYAQDHIGYIMADEKADWDRGGTEGTTTFWGWKLGDRLLRTNVDLMTALRNRTAPPADEFKVNYFYRNLPYTPAPVTPSAQAGRVVTEPQTIERFQATSFVWEGGDPVLDFPSVQMEACDSSGNNCLAARRANGSLLNTFFEMHLKYRLSASAHLWTVEFEAPKDWPVGNYRFAVSGKALGATASYVQHSAVFAVKPSPTLQLALSNSNQTATLSYTPRPNNYRVIDTVVRVDQAAPVRSGTVQFLDATGAVLATVVCPTTTISKGDCQTGIYRSPVAGATSARGFDSNPAANTTANAAGTPAPAAGAAYGSGGIGAFAQLMANLNSVIAALVNGDFEQAASDLMAALTDFGGDLVALITGDDDSVMAAAQHAADNAQTGNANGIYTLIHDLGRVIGLADDQIPTSADGVKLAVREVETVVLTGAQVPAWSVPAAQGTPYPYPSGATITGGALPEQLQKNGGHDAHNGVIVYPPAGTPAQLMGKPVEQIAAYAYRDGAFVEIPVQVDQKLPFFLANSASDFSVYSGTDEELSYEWDLERWQNSNAANACNAGYSKGMPDPVTGLDHDDEIAFMAKDAGGQAPIGALPADADLDRAEALQVVVLKDPLNPQYQSFVYLGLKKPGRSPKFAGQEVYVKYTRDANADQWIDRSFFADSDPQKLGTSNTGYGPNRSGTVCADGTPATQKNSTDRFPRDGLTVTTDAYRWHATGRWMIREIHIAKPGQTLTPNRAPGEGVSYGDDLIDRWKGRAFQQSPDSNISVVGFEDEQVNWEANSSLLGERRGPVRAIREVWGADSGTNVTKTETFYRDAVTSRYHVRVHPIPPDGLYTSWDYNRGAMIPAAGEDLPGGRYYTALRPQGVPIDGVNDDLGQVDSFTPLPVNNECPSADAGGFVPPNPDGQCPAFADVADPTFNLPLAFDNWEQVSAKGNLGSMVYTFELKGATSLTNPLVVPFYRDDACLDDGTGDDPVQRPYPGEAQSDMRVRRGYVAAAGGDGNASDASVNAQFAALPCAQKQGAYAAHGIHYFFTHDSDNAFVLGKPIDEIDGQQWQFMVPTAAPKNIGEPYVNNVRVPLLAAVLPMPTVISSNTDADGDGVKDDKDLCASTPAGQSPDANGCSAGQRDSDGDGVPDANDLCPNTASGQAVDGNGCSLAQRDTDGDGVKDNLDTCPNTVSGQAVDANGCSPAQRDSDGDAVNDDADLCPGTASGQLVNAQGCSAAQRDSDGDGVKDDRDNCPNTPAGQAVDANGCPVVVPSDTTPDAYSFSNASGVARSTVVSSNAVTITGIDAPSPISVVGGEYRINGGAYTSQAGSISNGNTVQLRHTSAATANTKTETTLMVGGVSGKFSSTTAAATGDSDPDAFTFGSKSGQAQNTLVVSDAITPVGYDTAAVVKSGAGTEYSLGCTQSNWTSAQGSLTPGQSICVRHTSAGSANSLKKTSLQIGATVGYFSSRTAP